MISVVVYLLAVELIILRGGARCYLACVVLRCIVVLPLCRTRLLNWTGLDSGTSNPACSLRYTADSLAIWPLYACGAAISHGCDAVHEAISELEGVRSVPGSRFRNVPACWRI